MENIEVSINHTVGELNTILKGLAELSYKESAVLIAKIKSLGESAITAEAACVSQAQAAADTYSPVAPSPPAAAPAAKPAKA